MSITKIEVIKLEYRTECWVWDEVPLLWRKSTWEESTGKGERKVARETKETPAFQPANISRERKQPPIPSYDSEKASTYWW